jgi:hypothetical protein
LIEQKVEPSSIQNYYRPIILLLEWIKESPGPATALGELELDGNQERRLTKTLDAWKRMRIKENKNGKISAAHANALENLWKDHWSDVATVVKTLKTVVMPRIIEMMAVPSKDYDWKYKCEFFELLMFALIVKRPCRPGTYASA